MTPWWFSFLCFLCFLAAADRHEELSCRAARCHWRCDAERSSQDEAEIRCPVSSFGSQQNSFHSPRMASQQDRQRLRFRFKGDLELFALVSDSSDEWISLWKSHAQQGWAATVLLLPSARALRFTGQGVLGDILADQHHDSGRRLGSSWSPWTQVQFSCGPSKRRWHTAVLDAGKMWIFAGDDGKLLNDLWYYDTVTLDGWVQASHSQNGSWPSPRFSHMAVMQGRKMWVFGGVVQSGLSKELWNYDMERGNWIGWSNLEGPTARESMTLVEGDGKLWMFGGYDGSIRSDLWCLTTGGDPLWTLISTGLVKPPGRYSHVAVQEAGKMWIFGGLTEAGLQADLWYFDISTFIWTEVDVTNGPSARESATAVSQPGQMWIFGGIDAKNQSDELWLLDLDWANLPAPSASRWRLMDGSNAGPNGRQYHVAVLDQGRMWVHNGELWYYATKTSTSSSSSKTTSTTSQSTTLTSTSSTSSSTTSSSNTSTTLTTTSSSTSTTQTSSTTSSSSSSSTSTTLTNTTTTSTITSTSTSTETSTTSSTSRTTTSSSTTLSTTSSTTSSSTTKTSTTTSTSKTSTSSSTTSQTSTTTSTSSSSSETSSTTRTESSTSTSMTKTSITTSWTSTSTSSMTSTWTIGNTTTVTFTSSTTQVKSLELVLTELLMSKVEEALTTSNASESAVTVIANAPEAAFTMSMVSFNTHSSRVINESSLPLAVPSFSSSASQPLLTSMSIKTLQLPGVDLPEVGDAVETASGKVRVLAAPLLQIALLDSDFEEAETNLSGLMIFRASKEAVDPASCTFLTDEGWSDEGLHLASREEIKNAFGDIDTSGTWCATSHLSVFALVRPCTFLETLQRDGKCFDAPSFGALIGSTCLCLCCSFCGIYTTVKSRHVVGGKMELSDVEGSSHEVPFQVKRPKRDLGQFHGVADADSKTLITWDVERPQTAGAAGGNQTLPIAQLMSPKKQVQLSLKTKFFSERSKLQLPRSGTMLSLQSFPDAFEVLPHPEQPSASSHEVPGSYGTYEIYGHRQYIEFFSETHQKWTSGSIEGSGFVQPMASDSLPTYDVRLNRQQIRRFIHLERIRPPFQQGDAVTVEVDDEWQPATVQRRQGYPLAYEVELSSGKQVVPGEKLRARFAKGEAIFAFQGMKAGWVQGIVQSESEETWPLILVSNQKDNQVMSVMQCLIRPSTKMEGLSS